MNYEDFCHIASVCIEQIGPKCRRFFSPSNFMKFEKDESGRIAILPFYLYVMRTVSFPPLALFFFFLLFLKKMKFIPYLVEFWWVHFYYCVKLKVSSFCSTFPFSLNFELQLVYTLPFLYGYMTVWSYVNPASLLLKSYSQ